MGVGSGVIWKGAMVYNRPQTAKPKSGNGARERRENSGACKNCPTHPTGESRRSPNPFLSRPFAYFAGNPFPLIG